MKFLRKTHRRRTHQKKECSVPWNCPICKYKIVCNQINEEVINNISDTDGFKLFWLYDTADES